MEIDVEAYSTWVADKWLEQQSWSSWYEYLGTRANGNHYYKLREEYKKLYNNKKEEILKGLLKFVINGNTSKESNT